MKGNMAKWIGTAVLVIMAGMTSLFIILRILSLISWPWVWVMAPFWIPTAIIAIILTVMLFVAAFRDRKEAMKRRKWH